MLPNRVVLFFVLFFSLNSFLTAQNADFVRNSLLQKSRQATKYFREQDFEKSLLLSREVLKQALLMNDIIIKPFDQSKLFKAMSTLIYDAKNVG